jgi:hypothetical protein
MKHIALLLIPAILILLLVSGCYTQLYRPGMEQANRQQQATLYNRYDSTAIDTTLRADTTGYQEYPNDSWYDWGRPVPYSPGPIWGWDYYSPPYYWDYFGYNNYYGTPWWYNYPYSPGYHGGHYGGSIAEPPSKRGGGRSHDNSGGGSYVAPPPPSNPPTYATPPPSSPPPQSGNSGDDNKRGGKRGH